MPLNGPILRLLDANANRAREAMRVMEDYARFVLNSPVLSGKIKILRHDFATIVGPIQAEAIIHRDTPGDVGRKIKTDSELTRADEASVVVAAGKRLAEALRAMEEYLKIIRPAEAVKIERLRYRAYEIERQIAMTIHPDNRMNHVRLYVVLTESACEIPWFQAAEQTIAGGADAIQLREKNLEGREFLSRAKKLVALCKSRNVISIINDRPDICVQADADGVHVGQEDLPAQDVRRIVGAQKIVGVSTHTIEQARQAVLDGADYLGIGPIFKSPTKPRHFVSGLPFAKSAMAEIRVPIVAIAGINMDNIQSVLDTGVKAVALTSAIFGSKNIRKMAKGFKRKLAQK